MPSPIIPLFKRTYCEWSNHNAMRLAAATAFYTMMSLAPLLIVALTALSFIFKSDVAQEDIKSRASMLLGDQGGEAVKQMLANLAQKSSHGVIATIIGFFIALVSGSSVFVSMQESLNTIWDVKPRHGMGWKSMLWSRVLSVLVLFGAGAILLGSLVLSTALPQIVSYLPNWLAWMSFVGEILISFIIIGFLFAAAFKILPNMEIQWKDAWMGAAMSAALFIAGKYGLALYFRFASTAPFGAAGSLAALMIWVYYSSAIVFFGAAFTRAYAERGGQSIKPDRFGAKVMSADSCDSDGESNSNMRSERQVITS